MTTLRQAAIEIGIPYRSALRFVRDYKLIRPAGYKARRYERVPEWTPAHMRELHAIVSLRERGLSMQTVRDVLRFLRKIGHNPVSSGRFLVILKPDGTPGNLVKLCDDASALQLMGDGRGQLLLPYADLLGE